MSVETTRYYRRQKVTAYRHTFMLGDGTPIDGEQFSNVQSTIDYTPARWFEADTGKEVTDPALLSRLNELLKNQKK